MPSGLDIANISSEDDLKVGALADGLATSAVNSTEVEDGSNGAVAVANAIGSNNDSSTTNTTSTEDSGNSEDNGNNRDNNYEWESKVNTTNTTQTSVDDHTKNESEIKDSFNTKDSGNSFAYSDSSTTTKDNGNSYDYASTKDSYNSSVKDSGNTSSFDLTSTKDSYNTSIKDSFNTDSSSHYDYSLGNLKDVQNAGNIGIAGGDLNFHIGDDYAFNLNLDNVLNSSLNGDGMHTGFSLVQANNLSDQDTASNMQMNNQGANNNIYPDSGHASSDPGASFDGGGSSSWDHHLASASNPTVHDATSYADASSIVSNSGFHQELVQGANMVSNATDIGIVGGNDHHDTTTNS